MGADADTDARSSLLDALAQALAAERRALLDHDIDALIRSTENKLLALQAVEAAALPPDAGTRVRELAELNRANGSLLARRRREVNWALRHLGRSESAPAYDAHGRTASLTQARSLGVG